MSKGKVLIVNTLDNTIFGWFGETADDSRVSLDNIKLVELEPNQYEEDFHNLIHGMEGIKVTDVDKKILTFDITPMEVPQTDAEKIAELQNKLLESEGVI